jgi:hypothetical protein
VGKEKPREWLGFNGGIVGRVIVGRVIVGRVRVRVVFGGRWLSFRLQIHTYWAHACATRARTLINRSLGPVSSTPLVPYIAVATICTAHVLYLNLDNDRVPPSSLLPSLPPSLTNTAQPRNPHKNITKDSSRHSLSQNC